MGSEYEVYYWDPDASKDILWWSGRWKENADAAMNRLKDIGKGCITLIWRPAFQPITRETGRGQEMLELEVKECERVRRLWKLFSLEVEHKLGQEALRGKTGWDTMSVDELRERMLYNAEQGQLIDSVAYAFFQYCRENFKNEMR